MSQTPSPVDRPANEVTVSAADIINPHVKLGMDYWGALCGQRRFPARADLTLRGMAAFLPYVVIISVIDAGADYEYRYVGDAQTRAFGVSFKGVRVSRIEAAAPPFGLLLRTTYEQIRATGAPLFIRGRVGHAPEDSQFLYHETAFLPLGAGDTAVDHLLIIGVSVPKPFWDLPTGELTILAEQARATILSA